ncbi:fructose-bisphosphate aldolase class I [Candidatus Kaiserbacteria bacterium]|nr:fructose-bisphosphate aldolase class I [Candidatus Kaiserbacteria bacterium]
MDVAKLNEVAKKLVAPGKGILAADESVATATKKLEKAGVPSTEESRRDYRQMLLTTPGLGEYISGVILFDETIRQKTAGGRSFVDVLTAAGILPGIKVDQGTKEMEGSPEEKVTKGLEGLPERLAEYAKMGAKFAKWRAVITIGEFAGRRIPTDANIRKNAKDLAAYAKMAQEAGLVPIVEPEVLMDGANTMAVCAEVSTRVLTALFKELKNAGVAIEGIVLKTNMAVPGKLSGEKATPAQVAEATLAVFNAVLPKELLGQAFLSGGQNDVEATANLDAMNSKPQPWKLTFSYGRALQDAPLKAWVGKPENIPAAQSALLKRAKMNSLATLGKYQRE